MQSPLLAPPVRSGLDVRAAEFAENRAAMLEKLAEIDRLHGEAEAGGGPEAPRAPREAREAPRARADRARARPRQPLPRDQLARRLQLGLRDRRRRGARHRRDRRRRVRDLRQRSHRAGRRAHPLRRQEVDARDRDRARQPDSVRELRRVGRRRPADGSGERRRQAQAAPREDQPLRRDRPVLLRDDRALEAPDPLGLRRLRVFDGGRRLPARDVGLQRA